MPDPFSIVAGAVGVVDVCWRVAKYLRDVRAAAATVEGDITGLLNEIEALTSVNELIKKAFEPDLFQSPTSPLSPVRFGRVDNLWRDTGKSLHDCHALVKKLEALVKEIYGKTPAVTGKIDGLSKQSRKRAKDAELRNIRGQLSSYRSGLQILLTAINLSTQRESQETTGRSLEGLRSQIANLQQSIDFSDSKDTYQNQHDFATLSALHRLRDSIDSVAAVVSGASPNKYFDIPQPVSSIYTGREIYLERLRTFFITPSFPGLNQQQNRFVVQGLGGSGKTQFCSKFAQDNRESFWGVFWIDASSHERIKQTFSQIAKIAGVEPNENAAMHWLSNLEQSWLLIIDNADDSRIGLEKYFPKGNRGHILVTTRNPAHKFYGNVDPGFFEFKGMEDEDASALLLRAASQPQPWDSSSSTLAARITKALGFLALALTHAGAAIRNGLCTLTNYLEFFDGSLERVRRARRPSHEMDHITVFATYEISYRGIEEKGSETAKDAIQLLKTFAFFYFENIRIDILKKAVTNRKVEEDQQEKDKKGKPEPSSWPQTFKNTKLAVLSFIFTNRGPPALPHVIRDARCSDYFDDVRLRYALTELVQMSLVMHDEKNDSYSMHPLVHQWARERTGMTTSEQGVWSQAAAATLAHSLLLPPHGGTESDEMFRRDLIPHVDHVRKCQQLIECRIADRQKSRWISWLNTKPSFGRDQALQYGKFSLVYMQSGRFCEAEQLQLAVKDFTLNVLGIEHATTRRVLLALSSTYYHLGQIDKATALQNTVLQACVNLLGRKHHETLMALDTLGQTYSLAGRITDARVLQEEAVRGLEKLLGLDHEDTLKATDNLGCTVTKFYDNIGEAKRLLTRAVNGMKKVLGPSHLSTLIAVENLAVLSLHVGGDFLHSALNMMHEVLEIRKMKLGKEHPYTLLAMVNMARLKNFIGEHDEAEQLVLTGLPIAVRNIGENHIGTLLGKWVLATILDKQGRYQEAEDILVDVVERQKHLSEYRGAFHPDRLGAMVELVGCYKSQEKINESLDLCDEALEGFRRISTREHPLAKKLKEQRKELVQLKDGGRIIDTDVSPDPGIGLQHSPTW